MSSGLFQNLPGAHEMAGIHALPSEPWLLPISDRMADAGEHTDALLRSVRRSSRPYRVAMHALVATLFLIVAAQVSLGGLGAGPSPRSIHQIAIATPPTIPITNAALIVHN